MMKDLGESQRNATHYMDELHRYQEKIKLLDITNTELRSQLKQSEQTLSCLHAKTLDNSTQALQKYDELQRKYEDCINKLNDKEQEMESLRDKNRELLDMNSKFDENWSDKFKEAIRNKDYIIEQLQREINEAGFREKEKAQSVLFQNKEEMKDKIYEIEQAYHSKLEEIKTTQQEAERHAEDTKREIADLKEMLKMSIEKEGRAKGLIQELTALIKQLQEQLDKELTEKMLIKTQYEDSIADLKQERNIYKSRSEKLTQRLQNIEQDMNLGENTLYQKNRELTEAGEQIDSARDSIKQLKIKMEKNEAYYEQDIE
jgi:DNA repair exonuclease SbcCD ATPase subunit